MKEQIPGTKQVAQRLHDADQNFLNTIMSIVDCSREEAQKVLNEYRRAGAVKRDAIGGRYRVTHGVYMEPDIIRNAIQL